MSDATPEAHGIGADEYIADVKRMLSAVEAHALRLSDGELCNARVVVAREAIEHAALVIDFLSRVPDRKEAERWTSGWSP